MSPTRDYDVVHTLKGGLVVSCQASPGHPLRDPSLIAAMARCAAAGGAVGLRIDSTEDIAAVRADVTLPILGIRKAYADTARPTITPGFTDCVDLVKAGADVVALEMTDDLGRSADDTTRLIHRVHDELNVPVMADISTFDEGATAWRAGADLVATTLVGYTSTSGSDTGPALDLVAALHAYGIRVVLEGRVEQPEQLADAFSAGAWTVVVGTAITDPVARTRAFVAAVPAAS